MSSAPFWDYDSLIHHLAWNVIHDGDNVITIDGPERSGKSVLAWKIMEDVSKRLKDLLQEACAKQPQRLKELETLPDFVPARDIILDWEDWVEAFDPSRRYARYLFDEGGNIGFSRDYSRGEQKGLVKICMQLGQVNSTNIFIIPNIEFFDRYFREHRTQIRIHVWRQGYERGFATVQWKHLNWRKGTYWYEDVIEELRFDDIEKGHDYRTYLAKKARALNTSVLEAFQAAKGRVAKNDKLKPKQPKTARTRP